MPDNVISSCIFRHTRALYNINLKICLFASVLKAHNFFFSLYWERTIHFNSRLRIWLPRSTFIVVHRTILRALRWKIRTWCDFFLVHFIIFFRGSCRLCVWFTTAKAKWNSKRETQCRCSRCCSCWCCHFLLSFVSYSV